MTDVSEFDLTTADGEPALPRFASPHDWEAIDRAVHSTGGAIVERLIDAQTVTTLNADIDRHLGSHDGAGAPWSGSDVYDLFLGHRTVRLHGLLEKVPSSAELIGHDGIVGWAERLLADVAASVLLNAGGLIQIMPGEPAQFPHRDSDSWPAVPVSEHPIIANAIVALDDCTLDNGATYVAPGSWAWPAERRLEETDWARAVMRAGDALLFRGDVLHGGGENTSDHRRRALSISYCADWLRPVENSFLTIPRSTAAAASPRVQALLGYPAHDASAIGGGILGLYENGDPAAALVQP